MLNDLETVIFKGRSLFLYVDFSPPKRTISQDGELRKEYEEELRKVNIIRQVVTYRLKIRPVPLVPYGGTV